jgi:hypothetical protein
MKIMTELTLVIGNKNYSYTRLTRSKKPGFLTEIEAGNEVF